MADEILVSITAVNKSFDIYYQTKAANIDTKAISADMQINTLNANIDYGVAQGLVQAPALNSNIQTSVTNAVTYNSININLLGVGEEAIPDYVSGNRFADSLLMIESIKLDFGTSQIDTFILSDSIDLALGYYREINEAITATDDVYGEADIDDQQYVLVNKTTSDYLSLSENILIDFSSDQFEIVTLNEAILIQIDSNKIESVGIQETFLKSFSKAQTDNLSITDSAIIQFQASRLIADNSSISDIVSKSLSTTFSDYTQITDALIYINEPRLNNGDNSNLSDLLQFAFDKIFSDSSQISDLISFSASFNRTSNDTASVSDSLLQGFNKNTPDDTAISDSTLFSYGNLLSDTASLIETVKASKQDYFLSGDYVDPTYNSQIFNI